MQKKKNLISHKITTNRRARYDFFIKKEYEAGLILQGWEVKSIRASRINISESYILVNKTGAYLFGAHVQPLLTSSTHISCDPMRNRKLLLKHKELNDLHDNIKKQGYTIIPLSMYWKNAWCKLQIGVAVGKKQYDKRLSIKEREWKITQSRTIKTILN